MTTTIMPSIGDADILHSGGKCIVQWKIPDLDSLSIINGGMFWSPYFVFEDRKWFMGIWPNGRKETRSVGHIGVRLVRASLGSAPILVQFSFALKTVNGKKDSERQKTEVFKGVIAHDIDHILSRSDYQRRKPEFLVSGFITVVCTLKQLSTVGTNTDENCTYCKEALDATFISLHEKCTDRLIKCPDCSHVILLKNWLHGHECQKKKTEECSYCKKDIDVENISTHEKKCMDKPIKCSECLRVIFSQKWHDHEYAVTMPEVSGKMMHDFTAAMLNGDHSDVTVKVKEEEFRLHKVILATRNPYFYSMFKNDMKEKLTGIVTIEDCDPDVFRSFIYFLYTGKADKLSPENVCDVYEAADKYQEDQLKWECLHLMLNTLSVDIFCDYFALALKHDEKELFQKAVELFILKGKEIGRSVKWQGFVKEYPIQANELYLKTLDHYVK